MSARIDAARIDTRTRWPVVIAAAIASAVLSPLVDELVLGGLPGNGTYRPGELVLLATWAASLGALLGGLAVHAGLRRDRGAAHVIAFATLAGAVYPVLFVGVGLLDELGGEGSAADLGRVLIAPLVLLLVGAIVSVPAGLVFGLIFAAGASPAHAALSRPSHEGPAIAWSGGARLLVGASALAVLLALGLEGRYCQMIFHSLLPALGLVAPPGTDIAWTRLVLLPAPLVVAAALFAARGHLLRRRLDATVRALVASSHPTWLLTDGDGEPDALPLRARDQRGNKVIRARVEGFPYRAAAPAIARLDPTA